MKYDHFYFYSQAKLQFWWEPWNAIFICIIHFSPKPSFCILCWYVRVRNHSAGRGGGRIFRNDGEASTQTSFICISPVTYCFLPFPPWKTWLNLSSSKRTAFDCSVGGGRERKIQHSRVPDCNDIRFESAGRLLAMNFHQGTKHIIIDVFVRYTRRVGKKEWLGLLS